MSIFARKSGPQRIVERFCAASNANDLETVARLLAPGFRMIDSAGEAIEGRANAVTALGRFFSLAPDFHIDIADISARGRQVFIRGRAVCSDERFAGEKLWRAVADDRRIHEWQSFSRGGTPHLTRILMPEISSAVPERRAG